MNEKVEGECNEQSRPYLCGVYAINENIASGDDQYKEFLQCSNGKGFGIERGKMIDHRANLGKSQVQRLPVCQHPAMLHNHFLCVMHDKHNGKGQDKNEYT